MWVFTVMEAGALGGVSLDWGLGKGMGVRERNRREEDGGKRKKGKE